MTAAAKARHTLCILVTLSLGLGMASCKRRQARVDAERPVARRLAFSLDGFPTDYSAVQRRLRSAGPPRLAPFGRPNLERPELLSKPELLRAFPSLVRSATSDTAVMLRNARAFTVAGLLQLVKFRLAEYTISDYAKEVAAKLGPIPSFNVFENGVIIPITLNDVELPAGLHSPSGKCDRPVLLPLGSDGQCVPYARIGRLPGTNPQTGELDPDIQWVFIARRYKIRTNPDDPTFEDVAIIGHNRKTGATAFFQMLDTQNGKNATRVPSPMEKAAETPAGFPTAQEFWLPPARTAQIGCNRCHDSDPFVHSPYVNQVLTGDQEQVVPSDPYGPYTFIGTRAFTAWDAPQQFVPDSNACTACHRIGVNYSSGSFAQWAAGELAPSQLSATYGSYPSSHWMPPGEAEKRTPKEWEDLYRNSVYQLLSCHETPSQPGCNKQGIP
jgi:hypothetical protein